VRPDYRVSRLMSKHSLWNTDTEPPQPYRLPSAVPNIYTVDTIPYTPIVVIEKEVTFAQNTHLKGLEGLSVHLNTGLLVLRFTIDLKIFKTRQFFVFCGVVLIRKCAHLNLLSCYPLFVPKCRLSRFYPKRMSCCFTHTVYC
jgi:hypothetical protein